MELEEITHLASQPLHVFPGGWNEHRGGMADIAAPAREELQRLIQDARVGAARVDDRPQELLGREISRTKMSFAGTQQRYVSSDRVDLPVVSQESEWLRAF